MDWTAQTAVVTGGTEGIGLALVERLLAHGARVAFCARTEARVTEQCARLAAPGHTLVGAPCDVRKPEEVERFARRVLHDLGTPTILVNNAGVARFVPLVEMSVEDWDLVMDTNLRGMFLVSRAFLPAMLTAGRGTIVNVSSLAGRNPVPDAAAYAASKHGVLGFSKSLMMELRKLGVRVIAVCPGSVDTPFFAKSGSRNPDRARILAAEDVAQAILDAVALPERALISELDIRPANP
jgi:3-oxoacyl-[acyl-carrier protein] reductase